MFFDLAEGTEVKQGKVNVTIKVLRASSAYELNFHTKGVVIVECDRCLSEMEMPIEADNKLVVTLGETYSEMSDEHITVSEEEGTINVAWFMYEFIVLALPLKRVHKAGDCDEEMAAKLREYSVEQADGNAETVSANGKIDARWETLRKLKEDN